MRNLQVKPRAEPPKGLNRKIPAYQNASVTVCFVFFLVLAHQVERGAGPSSLPGKPFPFQNGVEEASCCKLRSATIPNFHLSKPGAEGRGMEGLWGRALASAASGGRVAAAWAAVRARAVAPALEAAVWVCLAMSVMLVLEVCYMSVVSFVAVKLLRRVPERRYKWEPMPSVGGTGGGKDEEEAVPGGEAFPLVLVQIPMYNEREVRPFELAFSPAAADSHYRDPFCNSNIGITSLH
jgi:hypothetical protein